MIDDRFIDAAMVLPNLSQGIYQSIVIRDRPMTCLSLKLI